jgi:hypothetical protein
VLLDTNAAGMIKANQELLILPFLLINQPCNFCAAKAQNQTGVAKVIVSYSFSLSLRYFLYTKDLKSELCSEVTTVQVRQIPGP